jgi:adenylate kinase family enzyme
MAAAIARRLGIPHVELDAIRWLPNWTMIPDDLFREQVAEALSGEAWTVDGNYGKVRDIVWSRADSIVWLDYPRPVVMARMVRRTLKRLVTRQELWNGNRETWRNTFGRDSIVLWAWQSYHRRRAEYPGLLARSEHAHLAVVHLRAPREARCWLATL